MTIRDRIVELVRVRAGDLVPSPKNWRLHPPEQRRALAAMVDEVGFAGAVIARRLPDGRLEIIDGHARQEMDPDAELPVLVTDLDEDEAAKLLATYDPISFMANTDTEALKSLLASIQTDSVDVSALLKRVEFDAGIFEPKEKAPKPPPRPDPQMGDSLEEVLSGEKQWVVLEGDVHERLRDLPDACVQTVVTSPPYWGLRDYGTAQWEGGDEACDHQRVNVEDWVAALAQRPNPSGSGIGKAGETFRAQTEGMAAYREECGKCGAKRIDSQIGLEASFAEWVAEMVAVFAEVRRVLRDDGTVWLNLGDAYASSDTKTTGRADSLDPERPGRSDGATRGGDRTTKKMSANTPRERPDLPNPPAGWAGRDVTVQRIAVEGVKQKDLLGQPWAVAFALRADGWYLRSEIIWHKPNPMPESVTDRPTKSHETVFLLSKRPTYFFDADAVRQESKGLWNSAKGFSANGMRAAHTGYDNAPSNQFDGAASHPDKEQSGANLRDVWTIPTEAFAEAHFATFPRKLVEPCIRSATSEAGACPTCGAAWKRQTEATYEATGHSGGKLGTEAAVLGAAISGPQNMAMGQAYKTVTTIGWAQTCECEPAEPIGSLVLDPFNGSGTTGVVALAHGQRYVGIELSEEYAAMSRDRIARFREEQG